MFNELRKSTKDKRDDIESKEDFIALLRASLIDFYSKAALFAANQGDYSYVFKIRHERIKSVSYNESIFVEKFLKELISQGFEGATSMDNEYQYFDISWR